MESKESEAETYLKELLRTGATAPGDSEIDVEKQHLPVWFNEDLFKKGQTFYRRNIFAMFLGMLCGLISVLAIPTILNVLICTKKSSNPLTAYRRYIKTIFHVVTWHSEELTSDSSAWKSIISVRRTHLTSSKMCQRSDQNVFISQKDMALTQFGFMGYTTLKAHQLGIIASGEYLEATVHFWRVIGYMLGIADEFNICTDSWDTTKPRLKLVLTTLYRPALQTCDKKVLEMIEAMISGLWSFNPFLSVNTFFFFTKRLADCDGYQYLEGDFEDPQAYLGAKDNLVYKKFSVWTRSLIYILVILHQYMLTLAVFRIYFNFQMYLSLFLIYYFPFLAFPRFGFKKSYVRVAK